MNEAHGANQKRCSSMHTAMLLLETIGCNDEQGRTVYVALLDVRKAFDRVWLDGLFHKLREMQMDPKLWRILKEAYQDFQCCVMVGRETSDYFQPKQGIQQGNVWSMMLYCAYNNDLLSELQQSQYGAKVGTVRYTSQTFADDLTLVALSREGLN